MALWILILVLRSVCRVLLLGVAGTDFLRGLGKWKHQFTNLKNFMLPAELPCPAPLYLSTDAPTSDIAAITRTCGSWTCSETLCLWKTIFSVFPDYFDTDCINVNVTSSGDWLRWLHFATRLFEIKSVLGHLTIPFGFSIYF
ncbi:hypothetical protein PF008_g2723 [Phytophthora fragariae]|uniref:Uncharacterized protein n=1 Tax=Phytophthora fragariae TaxID=53985 RepID=A0A6G0SHE6_9STRA|nr:hypothetical protein PF008_g2723 [Phytophthora fragariae]